MTSLGIRTLYTIPCANAGVGMTCRSILRAAAIYGFRPDLFSARAKWSGTEPFLIHQTLPEVLDRVPYRMFSPFTDAVTHRRFLAALNEGDIAYLWPSVPLSVYEKLAARNIPVVTEAVNTLMSVAKPILDTAYDTLGLAPAHTITEARIKDQERRFALCDAVFVPNRITEEAMAGTALETKAIGTSFGTWVPGKLPERPARSPHAPVRFLFLGTVCVRKGVHLLLDAWRDAPSGVELRVVGPMEPAIEKLFADVLNGTNVSYAGYTRDVGSEFRRADVAILPSLEEGDPIATYEAAAHGLPILASQAGAGRLGAQAGIIDILDPTDKAELLGKIAEFAMSEELRRHRGANARRAVRDFDWTIVGPRRFLQVQERLARQGRASKTDIAHESLN